MKQAILAWIPRVTGMLSVLVSIIHRVYVVGVFSLLELTNNNWWCILQGSLFIIICGVAKRRKLGSTYHQLVVGAAIFDLCNSIGWMFSTLPVPEFDEYGVNEYIRSKWK